MYAQRSLSSVTVRRLKEDLRKLNIESFPERKVVQIDLRHYDRSWERRDSEGEWRSISPEKAAPLELILSSKLRRRLALRPQDRAGDELRPLPQREFLEVRGSETGQRLRYFSCQSSKTRSVQRSFRWSRTPSACSRSSF